MELPITGTCQCGEVSYAISADPMITIACHCQDCQKLSASAFSLTIVIAADSFELKSGELKVFERPTDAGGTAACYFCPTCGNRLYHVNPENPCIYRLKPGGLDDTSQIQPQAHVWTSRAQSWVKLPDDLPVFETQPDLNEFFASQQVD
ncbi:MAG: GFA family protein [Woeseiaceae bacterium]|nr:GFA family protein [Woeseiaceae bacterium]